MNWAIMTGMLAMATASFATSPASAQSDLDALRWKNRVLVLFASLQEDTRLREQSAWLLAGKDDLAERDLVVFTVAGDEVAAIYGEASAKSSADQWRRHFNLGADTDFAAILVGKDGGVKWRKKSIFKIDDLNAVIDAMPMRRSSR